MKRLFLPLLAAALWGCADAPLQPQPELPGPARLRGVVTSTCDGGGLDPTAIAPDANCESGANSTGWPFFGPAGNAPYQAAGDPYPSAQGIYLGSAVSPSACFADQNRDVINRDADHDWLSDTCELELARAFAPLWKMSRLDDCPGGEPYWAVKYFPSNLVRIAYMPAYYRDCGMLGHSGDSEFVMVEVSYNASTQHWLFNQMFLSAHYGAPTDHSSWVFMTDAEYSWKVRAHPTVWVAIGKHADYPSSSACGAMFDSCNWSSLDAFRFPVIPGHNVGSRSAYLKNCVYSEAFPSYVYECFWTGQSFLGWQTTYDSPPPLSYGTWLMGDKFEYRNGDPGPGPNPPPLTPGGPIY